MVSKSTIDGDILPSAFIDDYLNEDDISQSQPINSNRLIKGRGSVVLY